MTKRRQNAKLEKRYLSKNVHLPLKSWRKVKLSALLTVQYFLQLYDLNKIIRTLRLADGSVFSAAVGPKQDY